MKMMTRLLNPLTCAFVLLAGCASNIAVFDKGPVRAFGTGQKPQLVFDQIWVFPNDGRQGELPKLFIKLDADSQPVPIDQLTWKFASTHLPPFVPPTSSWPPRFQPSHSPESQIAPAMVDQYSGNGYHMRFKEGHLACLVMTLPAVIASDEHGPFYEMPLSMDQMIEVFGEPDQLWWYWEYSNACGWGRF